MEDGYTPELLKFLKLHNPNRTEEKIIELIQNTRKKTAKRVGVSVDKVTLSIEKNNKQIKINISP